MLTESRRKDDALPRKRIRSSVMKCVIAFMVHVRFGVQPIPSFPSCPSRLSHDLCLRRFALPCIALTSPLFIPALKSLPRKKKSGQTEYEAWRLFLWIVVSSCLHFRFVVPPLILPPPCMASVVPNHASFAPTLILPFWQLFIVWHLNASFVLHLFCL